MKYDVFIEARALNDLEEIYLFILQDSPQNAVSWYNGCVDALESLSHSPERCIKAPESGFFEEEILELFYGKFRILFTVRESRVHVLHIRHGAQRAWKGG